MNKRTVNCPTCDGEGSVSPAEFRAWGQERSEP